MKTVKFKNEKTVLNFKGQKLHANNLTFEKYDDLIKKNKAYEKYFKVTDPKKKDGNDNPNP